MGSAPKRLASHPADRLGRMDRSQLWRVRIVAGIGLIIGFVVAAVLPWHLGIDDTIWPKVLFTVSGGVLSAICVVLIVNVRGRLHG